MTSHTRRGDDTAVNLESTSRNARPRRWSLVSTRGAAILALTALGCSSASSFDVAASGDDSALGDASGDGSIGADTAPTDSASSDGSGKDTGTPPPPDDGAVDSIPPSDAPSFEVLPPTEAGTCPGTLCGSAPAVCTDLKTDPKNCGGCANEVCHLEVCRSGAPACSPGFKACGTPGCLGCRDIKSDPMNCGDCGRSCKLDELCIDGSCDGTIDCPPPLTACGAVGTPRGCYDLRRDPSACGACGASCRPGQLCSGGKCVRYASAPGCVSCPCAACGGETPQCCSYADAIVCAGACPT